MKLGKYTVHQTFAGFTVCILAGLVVGRDGVVLDGEAVSETDDTATPAPDVLARVEPGEEPEDGAVAVA